MVGEKAKNDSLLSVDLLNVKESIVLIHGGYLAAFLRHFPWLRPDWKPRLGDLIIPP